MLALVSANAHHSTKNLQLFEAEVPVTPIARNLPNAPSRIGLNQPHTVSMAKNCAQRPNGARRCASAAGCPSAAALSALGRFSDGDIRLHFFNVDQPEVADGPRPQQRLDVLFDS